MRRPQVGVAGPAETTAAPGVAQLGPIWGALVACVGIAFAPALGNGFVDWDDRPWIVENDAIRGLGWDQVRFAFTSFLGGVYQPLGWLIQGLTFELCGLDPRGYHRVSLLLHAVNVVLLHLLCVRLVARGMPAVAGRLGHGLGWLCGVPVLWYAVHPLRVEPVAWASCQAYLPSVTLSLLATLAYLRAHPPSGGTRWRWLVGSAGLAVLAVLAKGSAVVLPGVFLILDAYPLGRLGAGRLSWGATRRAVVEKGPILAVCLAFAAVAVAAKRDRVDPEVVAQPWPVARAAQASFGAWFYLEQTVWPDRIAPFYPRPERGDFLAPRFAVSLIGGVIAVAAVVATRRRWPWLAATAAAYLVIAAPYLGLARVGITLAADRYSYAPTMAWVVLLAAGICRGAGRGGSRPAWVAAGMGAVGVAGGLMLLGSAQCRVWGSSERLWAQAVERADWSAEVHKLRGASLADEGKLTPAIAEFRAALLIRPDYADAACDLGVALDRLGDNDAAIVALGEARRLRPGDPRVLLNLGAALERRGDLDEAVAVDRAGLAIRPDSPELRFNLGVALLRQGRTDAAVAELTTATRLRPRYVEAHALLGSAFVLRGDLAAAEGRFEEVLRLDPDQTPTRINLGLTLARRGRSAAAVAQLREAVRRNPRDPQAHHVLGALLLGQGVPDEAAAQFEEALRLRPDHAQARALLATARAGRADRR